MAISKLVRKFGPAFIATLTDFQCKAIMRRMEKLDFGPIPNYSDDQQENTYFYVGIIMERLGYERRS